MACSFWSMHILQIRNHFCWYQQKLKSGKVISFFLLQVNLLVKEGLYFTIWDDHFYLYILVCKFWPTDPLPTLKSHAKGFFWFQNVANYISFTRAKSLTSTLFTFFKKVRSSTFLCEQKCITVTINFTNRKIIS